MLRSLLIAVLVSASCQGATRILVTVVEQKTAKPATGLKAGDFIVTDSDTPRRVEAAGYTTAKVDLMLLVDSSRVGGMVQPVAADLIAQLDDREQMAMVAYHSSADLVQEFTSSKDLLRRALSQIKFGNQPRVLDAKFVAADDGGFESSVLRRVILLLTSGLEGSSRVREQSVIRLARRNGISIYSLYMSNQERGLFEAIARASGGAAMSIRELGKSDGKPAERVFEVIRGYYALTLSGNLAVGEKLKVE